jgi:hypothetical protein
MLSKLLLAGLFVIPLIAETPPAAWAQTAPDFAGAAKLSPSTTPPDNQFFAYVTSHGGTRVLGESTRVLASVVTNGQRVNGNVVAGLQIPWGFQTYEADFVGSQTPSGVNRVYLEKLSVNATGCAPCYAIHESIENPSSGDESWWLGTVAAMDQSGAASNGLYLNGNEVQGPLGYTHTLDPGTPVWLRQSGGTSGTGAVFSSIYSRLVLRPVSASSTDWEIAEMKGDGTFTGKILSMYAGPNEVFGLTQMIQASDWNRYTLVDQAAPGDNTTFEIRIPVGTVAGAAITPQGKTFIDAPLYNLDAMVTVKSASAFAGMAGIAFNLNAKPLTQLDQRFTYPGFIAFVPAVPERLAITQNNRTYAYPLDYHGSLPGVVFGIRGATGTCAQRGMLDYPVSAGVNVFSSYPGDKINGWLVCSLQWVWQANQQYRVRLWAVAPAGSWGAWIAKADGTDEVQLGTLTIPQDQFGNPAPQIASAAAFVRVNSPQACDKVAPIQIEVTSPRGNAGQSAALVVGGPTHSTCPGLTTVASCTNGTCTLGTQ